MALPNLLKSLGVGASTPVAANAQAPTVPTSPTAAPAPSLPSFNRTATATQGASSLLNTAAPTAAQTQATGNTPVSTAIDLSRSFGNGAFQFSPEQQQRLSQFDPNRVNDLFEAIESNFQAALQQMERGPLRAGDLTQNPVLFLRTVNRLVRQGVPEAQAVSIANRQLGPGSRNQAGMRTNRAVDFFTDFFSAPNYLQAVINAGFFNPGFQGGTGRPT